MSDLRDWLAWLSAGGMARHRTLCLVHKVCGSGEQLSGWRRVSPLCRRPKRPRGDTSGRPARRFSVADRDFPAVVRRPAVRRPVTFANCPYRRSAAACGDISLPCGRRRTDVPLHTRILALLLSQLAQTLLSANAAFRVWWCDVSSFMTSSFNRPDALS